MMHAQAPFRLALALVLACALMLPARLHAAPDGSAREFRVTAQDDGLTSWFDVAGLPGRNPDIPIDPGASVTIHLRNNGTMPHDFVVTALGGIVCCVAPGGSADGSFIAPASDTAIAYLCDQHPDSMRGRFVVGDGPDHGTPWPFLPALLALLLVAAARKPYAEAIRRRAR